MMPSGGEVVSAALSGSARLAQILGEMNRQGGFPISVLTDKAGFPLASAAAAGNDPDLQAAVAALIQRVSYQTRKVNMGAVDEISVYDVDRRRLVCREFTLDDQWLILAVMVPEGRTYRRLTSEAFRAIRRAWRA